MGQNKPVQGIGVALSQQVGVERILVERCDSVRVYTFGELHTKVVQVSVVLPIFGRELVGPLVNDDQSHILHHREQLGEGMRR